MTDLTGKTWEELVLMLDKNAHETKRKIKYLAEELEEIQFDFIHSELCEYIDAHKKKIIIPKWNSIKEVTPDDLEVAVIEYMVFCESDNIHKARWRDGQFDTWADWLDEPYWVYDNSIMYWLPLIYPTMY